MHRLRALVVRVFALLHPRGADADFAAELESHIAMHTEDGIRAGLTPEEARRRALVELGGAEQVRQAFRDRRTLPWIESLVQDLRYGVRGLRRNLGFTLTVVLTLALGIGAATAMLTVIDHVLLRPLPFRDAGRFVVMNEHGAEGRVLLGVPWLDLQQWMAQSRSFSQFAFYKAMSGRNFMEEDGGTMQIEGELVSSNLFSMLGVSPTLGRNFISETMGFGPSENANMAILSDEAWKEAYGADPAILGKSIRINKKSYVVVGVMPPGFEMPFDSSHPQVWTTITLGSEDRKRQYDSPNYSVIARLRSGVDIETAQAEMSTIQRRIASEYTDPRFRHLRSDAGVIPYADSLVAADIKKALLALLAAAGVLWLIAAVNATNLLLARGAARQREIGMRGALGATRLRVVQQFLVEGLVLSGAATLLGTGLALGAVRLIRSVKPLHLDLDLSAHVNQTILAMLCALTLITALVSSAWPALLAARAPIEPALKQDGPHSGSGRGQHRVRSVMVAAEVALSLMLLVACGLLLRTVYELRHVSLGYRTDHILVAHLAIPSYQYSGENMVVDLYQPLLDRVRHLRGVGAAGFMSEVPLGQSFNIMLTLYMNGRSSTATMKVASPEIEKIFGFKMAVGRFFNDKDTAASEPVVVVNEAFARLHSPNPHDPNSIVGQTFMNLRKNAPARIIGVIDDEGQMKVGDPAQPEVEICLPQLSPDSSMYGPATIAMDLAVRTERAPASMIPDLRSILRQANPEFAHATFDTMNQVVEDSFGSQRLAAHILEIFGASALLLSIAGLYGLLAWVVTQRTREMGIRIALGAQRRNLLWLVMRQAGGMLLVGMAVGLGLAWLTARFVRTYLYGVSAHDGWTMALAAAMLCASGLLAAYIPARRAARVDPIVALRAE